MVFDMNGLRYERVKLVRTYHNSLPDQYISVRSEEGEELMLISSLTKLDDISSQIVQEELKLLHLIPVIERISSIRRQQSIWTWNVQTDLGQTTFMTENAHDHIHSVAPCRWVITDLDGRRYLLADSENLDAASRNQWNRII